MKRNTPTAHLFRSQCLFTDHFSPRAHKEGNFGAHLIVCLCVCVCVCVAPGERRGVWSLPRGPVRLSDRGADQTENQTAHQSHQGEGLQAEGECSCVAADPFHMHKDTFSKLHTPLISSISLLASIFLPSFLALSQQHFWSDLIL